MRGRFSRISLPRRLVHDLLAFSRRLPLVTFERRMHLAPLVEARSRMAERPAWTAVFAKAFALVSQDMPALRRAYVRLPWPHYYEYPGTVAAIVLERDYGGEDSLFFALVKQPEALPLDEISRRIRRLAGAPVGDVKEFARMLAIARLPLPLRRAIWWIGLNIGRQRANYFGCFGITAVAGQGASHVSVLSPLSFTLTYGELGPDGTLDVRLTFDHRVIDGRPAARALARLEEVLLGPITRELMAAARP
jgi:hypothetical protein